MGLSADAAMQLLREAMEGLLVPDLVARAIFDALGEYGGNLPQRGKDLKTFVEGPLSRTLMRRVDEATRLAILERLRPIVEAIIQSEIPPPAAVVPRVAIPAAPSSGFDQLPTERRLTQSHPYVLIVAGGRSMQVRLRLAVGASLEVSTVRNAVELHAAILARSPRLLLVDAADPADIAARELARALSRACVDSLVVVWGSTRPVGADVLSRLSDAAPPAIGLEEAEGVEPLLDVVRSHGMPHVEPRTFAKPAAERASPPAAPQGHGSRPTPRYGDIPPARRRER